MLSSANRNAAQTHTHTYTAADGKGRALRPRGIGGAHGKLWLLWQETRRDGELAPPRSNIPFVPSAASRRTRAAPAEPPLTAENRRSRGDVPLVHSPLPLAPAAPPPPTPTSPNHRLPNVSVPGEEKFCDSRCSGDDSPPPHVGLRLLKGACPPSLLSPEVYRLNCFDPPQTHTSFFRPCGWVSDWSCFSRTGAHFTLPCRLGPHHRARGHHEDLEAADELCLPGLGTARLVSVRRGAER